MLKIAVTASAVALLFLCLNSRDKRSLKYKVVEAYEIRPGILMMPTYSADGEVCRMAIQKDHYHDGIIDLDGSLPPEALDQVIDELVPAGTRGPLTLDKEFDGLSLHAGNTVTSFHDYKNVTIDMVRPESSQENVVGVIEWKNPKCPQL